MNAKYLTILAAIVMIGSAMFFITSVSDDSDAATGDLHKLTYYGEVDDTVVVDRTVAAVTGTIITLYAPTNVDGYDFVGWEYNGEVYEVGSKFIMPSEDVKLTATWEGVVLADDVTSAADTTMMLMIFVALMAIAAVICSVLIQTMRKNAMRSI